MTKKGDDLTIVQGYAFPHAMLGTHYVGQWSLVYQP